MAIYIDGVRVSGGGGTAADVPYDNTDSGLTATDVQEAIDELADNAGSSTLSGLSDVTITSPTTDQVLKYDGSKWVNGTGGSGGVSDYEDLTNKPQVNGVTLSGDKDSEDLGIVWEGTQLQYDAIVTKDPNTTYYITDADDGGDNFQPIIYSEIEREIGVWTDGKPLYEKSYYVAQLPAVQDNVDISYNITNLGEVVSLSGIMINSTSHISIMLPYTVNSEYSVFLTAYETYIRIGVNNDRSAFKAIVTIRYTKTTDTAGSGTWTPQGVPAVHYSTDEQVVGTWIDGSTVYERVIDLGSNTSIDYQSWTLTSISLSSVSRLISISGLDYAGNAFYGDLLGGNNNGYLQLLTTRNGNIVTIRYIIFRYTKSS